MKQNLFDNPRFFTCYKAMRDSNAGLNEVLEQPAIKSLLPELKNQVILEIGFGYGEFCKYLITNGAKNVVGIDISKKMLSIARQRNTDDRIAFIEASIEDFDTKPASFDIIISSLVFHYISDLNTLFKKINVFLKNGGHLIFSIEHPVATCSQGIHPGWHKNEYGEKIFWQVDEYANEGIRKSFWFVDGVIKYHRQLSTIFNDLIYNAFQIDRVLEPTAIKEEEIKRPELLEERKRPPFLIVKTHKITEPVVSHDRAIKRSPGL